MRLCELADFCSREGAPPPTKRCVVADSHLGTRAVKVRKLANGSGVECEASSPPELHVHTQIDLLRRGDFAGAFALNSVANRARLGDMDQFEAMVVGSSSFAALSDPENACKCLEAGHSDVGRYSIAAELRTAEGTITFTFDVSETDTGYATEGVRVECSV